jgi:hypothetical protein
MPFSFEGVNLSITLTGLPAVARLFLQSARFSVRECVGPDRLFDDFGHRRRFLMGICSFGADKPERAPDLVHENMQSALTSLRAAVCLVIRARCCSWFRTEQTSGLLRAFPHQRFKLVGRWVS